MRSLDRRCNNCPNADIEVIVAVWNTLISISLVAYPSVLTQEPYNVAPFSPGAAVGIGLVWCCITIAQWVGLFNRNCALRMYASGYAFAMWIIVVGFYVLAMVHWLGLMGACVIVGALGVAHRRLFLHRRTVHGQHNAGMAHDIP